MRTRCPTHCQTTLCHSRCQSTAAIRLVASSKGSFKVDAGSVYRWLAQALLVRCYVCVVARTADVEKSARLADSNSSFGTSLLLQVLNKLVAHRSSRAKKADAFFSISTSPRSCLFSVSSCLMRWCSAVNGLPMPLWPDCSASNWTSQPLTALSPSFMSLHTWLMLKPCVLTICTTCSLKFEVCIKYSSGFRIAHGSCHFGFNNLSDCLFLLDHYKHFPAIGWQLLSIGSAHAVVIRGLRKLEGYCHALTESRSIAAASSLGSSKRRATGTPRTSASF